MTDNLPIKSSGFELTEENKTLLKSIVARGASDSEFELFLAHCKATGLNPFKKEIWLIKTKDQIQIMTGVNGFYAIANSHPAFNGIKVEIIDGPDGRPIKAVCTVRRKDREFPMQFEAYMEEYAKPFGVWKQMPRVMLSKCAESMALRKSFPQELNGLYSVDEMPAEYAHPDIEAQPAQIPSPQQEQPKKRGRPTGSIVPKWEAGTVSSYSLAKMSPEQLKWFRAERLNPAIAAGIDHYEASGVVQVACRFLPAEKLDAFLVDEPSRERALPGIPAMEEYAGE